MCIGGGKLGWKSWGWDSRFDVAASSMSVPK